VARVRFFPEEGKKGEASIMVNGLDYKNYFPLVRYRQAAAAPLRLLSQPRGRIEVKVGGGGVMAQAEAITLGLARALVKFNPELKTQLRAFGYLTRDPRMVERKKYGLKKARRAPQWSKR
jgi:small subunit ribosomal protein S9